MFQVGEWYFKSKRYDHGRWLAWCAKTPELGDNPLEIDPSNPDVYFEFADTEEQAIAALKREVLN
jgi:hypothetical protein